jgi:exodeoxyribonuclease-1
MPATLYWYDYETFGSDPMRDRPAQFAGLRTDEELNPIGDPLVLYCRPAEDFLPQPQACLITGITPQLARAQGIHEAAFISRILAEFSQPQTCIAGYNNIRFDDEITRQCLYRNLFDPYAHEWQGGNSRWDLIDVVRLTYALRPEGIVWPKREDGAPSFKLDQLVIANGIAHSCAHEALADVRATIELARLLRARQPKLYAYCFSHRFKAHARQLLDLTAMQPVLHVSEKYPAHRGCLAMVAPVGVSPTNPNGVVVYDLSVDPEPFLSLAAEDLRALLFTPGERLPEGIERPPLKIVRINRCPILVPVAALRPQDAERLNLNPARCLKHLKTLRRHRDRLCALLPELFKPPKEAPTDPDLLLYRGGFFSAADRARLEELKRLPPERLGKLPLAFEDPRLPELVFRYRARNWPETLTLEEHQRWDEFRRQRLTQPEGGASIVWDQYWEELKKLKRSESDQHRIEILKMLAAYAREIFPTPSPCLGGKRLA